MSTRRVGTSVTIVDRFMAAYAGSDVAGPELLPVRLARACAGVLPVAGVGISTFGPPGLRIPVGPSDDDAATAERLQFTTGEGPCLDAHALSRSVLATESLIAQRWPQFHASLVDRTPFRAIAAIPWPGALQGAGTMDFLFHRSADLAGADIGDMDAVVARVAHILDTDSEVAFSPLGPGPVWLNASPVSSRNTVVIAMGMLNVALQVSTPDALALLRARAYASNRTVDDIAVDVVDRRLSTDELRMPAGE